MKKKIILATIIAIILVGNIFAQQPSPQMQAANQLVRAQKWTEAVTALEEITKTSPQNGRAWLLLGTSYHQLKQYEKAVTAYEKNIPISNNPTAMYNLACAYSRLKQTDKAFEWLEKSITGGIFGVNLQTDEDLNNIRNDARFPKIVETLDRKTKPCMYQPESRQFDFWIGTWEAFTTQGQKAGDNVIQMFANGCGLLENWTSTLGGDGKSINYYDKNTGKWYQNWIGANGQPTFFTGSFKDGAMRFESESVINGAKTINYLTFTKIDDDTFRQVGESSTDNGKTKTVTFDFKYVRKK